MQGQDNDDEVAWLQADQVQLAQWRRNCQQALHSKVQQATSEMKSEVARLGDLCGSLNGLMQVKSEAESLYDQTVASAEESRKLMRDASKANVDVDQWSGEEAALKAQVCSHQEKLQKQEQLAKAQLAAFETLFQQWNDSMGLDIQRIAPSTVRVTFHFCEYEHHRKCSFALAAEGEKFSVSDLSPALPHARLARLVARLNAEGNASVALPVFICCMRRAFLQRRSNLGCQGGA